MRFIFGPDGLTDGLCWIVMNGWRFCLMDGQKIFGQKSLVDIKAWMDRLFVNGQAEQVLPAYDILGQEILFNLT